MKIVLLKYRPSEDKNLLSVFLLPIFITKIIHIR